LDAGFAAVSGGPSDSFNAAFGNIKNDCGACLELYRAKKS
jgi:hypothetical protein